MIKVDGVVVLYNPDDDVFKNINSYVKDVSRLYVVDNSDNKNMNLIETIKDVENVEYIDLKENKGIAFALNEGCIKSIENKSDYILTMDQDSCFKKGTLDKMKEYIEKSKDENIGIISPFHYNSVHNVSEEENKRMNLLGVKEEISFVDVVMTSGNLLNLAAYRECGKFRDDFFIDYVDSEYCLRLKRNGYKIIQLNKVNLYHNLGFIERKGIGKLKFTVTNHSAFRRYYITRNRMAMWKEYGNDFKEYIDYDRNYFYKELVKIIIGEKYKVKKLKNIFKGFKDYKNQNFGKLK